MTETADSRVMAYDIAQSVASAQIGDLLEGLVDRPIVDEGGFSGVITQLGNVAMEKARHLRATWQDEAAATRYDALAESLWALAELLRVS